MDKDLEAHIPLNGGNADGENGKDLSQSESRTPLKTPTKDVEVKFVASDSLNGEPKIQLEHGAGGLSGMTKEELLKYVNDPFWVRTRTILFILFWAVWLAMFAAAIAIVILAPEKCQALKPREWYAEGPIIEVDLPKSESSLAGLTKKISEFNEMSAKAIILPDLTRKVGGSTVDFKSISTSYGTLQDFTDLVRAAKEKAVKVIVSLTPNYSGDEHEWFIRSAAKIEPFTDYYIWKSTSAEDKLPNNWLSTNDGPAWTYHKNRKEYYLHQFNSTQPDLNFRNSKVIDEFKQIIEFWLSLGVSGFNFDKVQYLFEDATLAEEVGGSTPGAEHTQYAFWNHFRTHNLPETADLLASWRDLVKSNDTNRIVIISGEPPIAATMNKTVADVFRGEPLIADVEKPLTANGLNERIKSVLKNRSFADWPAVDVLPSGRYIAELGDPAVDALNIITLLLPGTPLIQLGDECGVNADEIAKWLASTDYKINNPHCQISKEVAQLRSSQPILHGATNIRVVNNGSALAVARWKAGAPGFLAVWNSSPNNETINLSGPSYLPGELITVTSGASGGPLPHSHVATEKFNLPPDGSVLFTFVPAENEA